jgi:hypothetical protein
MTTLLHRRTLIQLGGAALLAPLVPRAALAAYKPETVKNGGRISGVVRYAGKAPRPKKVKLSGDSAYCRKFDLREEGLLVGKGKALRNVVVLLEGIRSGKPVPSETPSMAEDRCTFVPHVLSVTTRVKVEFVNRDPVLNTFHASTHPGGQTLFNIGTPKKGQKFRRRIAKPGIVEMRCDVHPWELAWIVAVDHPYHCVTDEKGAFALEQIPPGRYTLALWHEKLGTRKRKVELNPGAHLKLELTYPGR